MPDYVTREAYSQEVSSCGFWPGGPGLELPVFYSYAYPEPAGFAESRIAPADGFYHRDFREFVLPYDSIRLAGNPDADLLRFLQSTYEAAALGGDWDRGTLELRESPAKWKEHPDVRTP